MNIVIKPFITPKGNYIYNRETNSILSVSADEFLGFCRIEKKEATKSDLKMLKSFQENGFCKETSLKHIEHPQNKFLEFHLENKIEKITLQVTQNCNLRCSYCIYSGSYMQRSHANNVMPYETMKKSVDFLMKRSINSKQVDIGFYGGEPLLAFKNIKKLLTYIKGKYPSKEITYSMTTNGTIFTDEMIQFLIDSNFSVCISIDGPKEIHDQNRVFINGKGSFDKIMDNLQYIKGNYPQLYKNMSFNTVIAPGNDYQCISDFYDASEIIEDGMLFSTLVNDFNTKEEIQYDEQYYIIYHIQRTKMLLAALGYISQNQVSKLFDQDLENIKRFYNNLGRISSLGLTAHPSGPCIPGERRPMVDVNGKIFPCERVSEASNSMIIGDIDTGFDMDKARAILNIGKLTEKECLECWNFLHCGMCAAAADDTQKLSREEKLGRCQGAMNNTMSMFETICLLKENNFNFEKGRYYG